MRNYLLGAGALALLALTGCDSGGRGGDDAVPAATWATLLAADPDGDAVAIEDPDAMAAELDATFGMAEAEPVALDDKDSLDDATRRAVAGRPPRDVRNR